MFHSQFSVVNFMLMGTLGGAAGIVTLPGAGFWAAYLYRRGASAGEIPITARIGARMGWMTGLFAFVLSLVQITLSVLFAETPLREVFRRLVEQQKPPSPDLQRIMEVINSTAGFAALIVTMLVFLFISCTLLATLGGAVGAQFPTVKPREKKIS